MLIDQIVYGFIIGLVYSLIALGFTLIYNTTGVIHFAQGELSMLSGFIALMVSGYFAKIFFLPIIPIFLVCFVSVSLIGIFLERCIYRPMVNLNASLICRIICTLAVALTFQNLAIIVWGARANLLPGGNLLLGGPIVLRGYTVKPITYYTLVITVSLMITLHLFLKKTKLGLAMRAVAYNHELAALMGVRTHLLMMLSFGIGAGLAAIAGLLLGIMLFVQFQVGFIAFKGFYGAVLGGLGSFPGAIVGGILIGIIENIGAGYVSSGYKDAIAFLVLLVFLLFRPNGLFRGRVQEKV